MTIPHIHRLYVLFLEPRKPPKTPFWASETPWISVERLVGLVQPGCGLILVRERPRTRSMAVGWVRWAILAISPDGPIWARFGPWPGAAIWAMGRCGSTEKRPIGWKKSLRYAGALGGPRWHTKWLGPIRGR